jgi:site-specific recombinase XerD
VARQQPPSYPSTPAPATTGQEAVGGSRLTVTELLPSYARHLRAEGKTTGTVDHTYLPALARFEAFLADQGMPRAVQAIRREHVEAYIVALQALGRKPATVNLAYRSLQPFWRWCVEEDELRESPMTRMKPPLVPEDPPPVVTDDELARLLAACRGNDFEERRDYALVSLLADSGMRRGECAGLRVEDLDLDRNAVVIQGATSKSRRQRTTRFGAGTARALDRYVRVRRTHATIGETALWIGKRGPMTGSGLLQVIERRGRQAGIEHLHPHLFRHSFAHQWLADGGQEGDLMELAGWRDRGMLRRYGQSAAADRARANYRSPIDRLRDRSRPAR